ncbi:MAG: hypothetical protein ABR986_08430 [Methanomassiliicoccales archaeon]|jgi:hypothetical protein
MKKAHLIAVALLAIIVIGGILLFYGQSGTPSERTILSASEIPGDNWTAFMGDNYILDTHNSSDSVVRWFQHGNESGEVRVQLILYHYSSDNEALLTMEKAINSWAKDPSNATITTVDVGKIGQLYQFHEFALLYDFPGQSNSTQLDFLKSDFIAYMHFYWSTDKLINDSEVMRMVKLQADKIP